MHTPNLTRTAAVCALLLAAAHPGIAWSNRGHRLINLVAASSFPSDMPAFMRTPEAIAEISYLGPEPDRWRPQTEPELSNVSAPDHVFRVEMGIEDSPLPRRRTEFVTHLEQLRAQGAAQPNLLRPEQIGTLPWQAEEVFERLMSAFRSYRIATGDLKESAWEDEAPITAADLPSIQASAIYYAGWLGHYIGDGCMPLHTSVNVHGWLLKDNPNGYNRNGDIHHRLEVVTDGAIEDHQVTLDHILPNEPRAQVYADPFAATLKYLQLENRYVEDVFKFDKQGAIEKSGTPEFNHFVEQRMAEGGAMLRDLIYSAWVQSKQSVRPTLPSAIAMPINDPSLNVPGGETK
jgi:hypothetical protein